MDAYRAFKIKNTIIGSSQKQNQRALFLKTLETQIRYPLLLILFAL